MEMQRAMLRDIGTIARTTRQMRIPSPDFVNGVQADSTVAVVRGNGASEGTWLEAFPGGYRIWDNKPRLPCRPIRRFAAAYRHARDLRHSRHRSG
jgi:hypothetical protein